MKPSRQSSAPSTRRSRTTACHHRDPAEQLVPEGVVGEQRVARVHEVDAVAVVRERRVPDDRPVGAVEVDPVPAARKRAVGHGHSRLHAGYPHEAVPPVRRPVDAEAPDDGV